uniref:Uncharacterized protein n=1 Tax=Coccolithus braarudii TaxID=221442 RepID=A0A7S0PUF4_9EUKA|mmetsp:Transcript_12773/g.27573  ORF Transcript_12773/g.27573 Transcript_12773/m.27573 type:complete len:116 (+) Transcript_12773:126-473(+)
MAERRRVWTPLHRGKSLRLLRIVYSKKFTQVACLPTSSADEPHNFGIVIFADSIPKFLGDALLSLKRHTLEVCGKVVLEKGKALALEIGKRYSSSVLKIRDGKKPRVCPAMSTVE